MSATQYAERTPPEAMRPWFARVWGCRVGDDGTLLAPPDGSTSLLVIRHPELATHLLTSGPWFRPPQLVVRPGAQLWGFRIQPHAIREVLSVEPDTVLDRIHAADRFLGAHAHRIAAGLQAAESIDQAAAVLVKHFERVVPRIPLPDQVAAEAIRRINQHEGAVSLERVAAEMDLVPRTIATRFTKATGMHPRDFARVRRAFYGCTGVLLGRNTWLTEVDDTNVARRAELVGEFLELTGRTPADFVALARTVEQDILRV